MSDNVPAKRGMLALIERRHSSLSLKEGLREYSRFYVGVVSSVTREGMAKSVTLADGRTIKQRDWTSILVDGRGIVCDANAFVRKLIDNGNPIEYESQAKAAAAIRATVKGY